MPRQDVPYGGAICRLKERIAEIWDKLDQKLHSINGVEGDGAGNVDIASGDAAVVITNDQIGHRIEVALDKSKLPAAAVSSVNGQTGAVMLDAAHIPSNENSNVQADIDWYKMRINECFDSIATEQDDRQNADATLQTNINAVSASIPEMSTTPDPYKGVERDAQGRAFAADPESGAADKTLVTANWVSQTGNGAPNNLIHRSGNETRSGSLTGQSEIPFISKTPYPEFLQSGIPTAARQTFLNRLLDYDGNETCRFYERHLTDGTKYIEIYLSVYGSDEVLYHPFIRMELTNDNKLVGRCSSRGSSNIADYSNSEIVTIDTLKRLGLI